MSKSFGFAFRGVCGTILFLALAGFVPAESNDTATSGSAVDLAQLVPDETLIYLGGKSFPDLKDKWNATPFYRMYTDPRFEVFFRKDASLENQEKKKSEDKKDEENKDDVRRPDDAFGESLPDLCNGEFALFASDWKVNYDPTKDIKYQESNAGMIVRTKMDWEEARQYVEEKIIGEVPSDADRSTATVRGVKLYTCAFRVKAPLDIPDHTKMPEELRDSKSQAIAEEVGFVDYHYEYAMTDGLLFVLEGQRAFLNKVISNYFAWKDGKPSPSSLGQTANYRETVQTWPGTPDAVFYANVERWVSQAAMDPDMMKFMKAPALSLGGFRGAGIAGYMHKDAIEGRLAITTVANPTGLPALFAKERPNAFRSQRLVAPDAITYGTGIVNLSEIYQIVQDGLAQVEGPQGVLILNMAVDRLAQTTGVKVREELIPAFSGEITNYSRVHSGGGATTPDTTVGAWIFEVVKPGVDEKIAKIVSSFVNSIGAPAKMQTVDFQGFPIRALHPDKDAGAGMSAMADGTDLYIAQADRFLIVSANLDEVKSILRRVRGDEPGGMQNNAEFHRAIARLDSGYTSVSWMNIASGVENLVELLRSPALRNTLDNDVIKIDALPDPETVAGFFDQAAISKHPTGNRTDMQLIWLYPESMRAR
jgi:hypothetical protein